MRTRAVHNWHLNYAIPLPQRDFETARMGG